jgi:hypothetical protein
MGPRLTLPIDACMRVCCTRCQRPNWLRGTRCLFDLTSRCSLCRFFWTCHSSRCTRTRLAVTLFMMLVVTTVAAAAASAQVEVVATEMTAMVSVVQAVAVAVAVSLGAGVVNSKPHCLKHTLSNPRCTTSQWCVVTLLHRAVPNHRVGHQVLSPPPAYRRLPTRTHSTPVILPTPTHPPPPPHTHTYTPPPPPLPPPHTHVHTVTTSHHHTFAPTRSLVYTHAHPPAVHHCVSSCSRAVVRRQGART